MIKEIYDKIHKNDFEWVIVIISWPIAHTIDTDAIIVSRLFWYKKVLLWKDIAYLKTSFSVNFLKQVISKIKSEFSLWVQVWEINKDTKKIKLKTHYKAKFKIKKEELVNSWHLIQTIENMKDEVKEDISKKIIRFKEVEDRRFELHKKALETYKQCSFAVWRYLPKTHRETIAKDYFSFWHRLLENINKLRSINMIKNNEIIYKEKINIFYNISVLIDLIKDFSENIFSLKWFKNREQYIFIQTCISEIAKISRWTYTSYIKKS